MLESLFDKVTGLRLATLLKVTFLHWCFSRFLTFTNDKLCRVSYGSVIKPKQYNSRNRNDTFMLQRI